MRIIAIGGGKGGVGKSYVAANLACAIARSGARVVLFDADLGAPNLHTLFGIGQPTWTVDAFVTGECPSLTEATVQTSVRGLSLVCGSPHALGAANIHWNAKRKLIRGIKSLKADCLVLDVGAGTSLNTLDFFNAGDIRLVVMTPEITSVQNAYSFVKAAIFRRLQRAVQENKVAREVARELGSHAFEDGSNLDNVEAFFSVVERQTPELVDAFRMLLREYNASLIGNMLRRGGDRNVFSAVQRMLSKFLGLSTPVEGVFQSTTSVRECVNAGQPLVVQSPYDPESVGFLTLANRLMAQDLGPIHTLRKHISSALSAEDRVFAFGVDGMEVVEIEEITEDEASALEEHGAEVVCEADDGDTTPTFDPIYEAYQECLDELLMIRTDSARAREYVEVELGGHWHLGTLVHANDVGARVSGVRPLADVSDGALRVIGDQRAQPKPAGSAVQIRINSTDHETGDLILEFTEPAMASPLVARFAAQ